MAETNDVCMANIKYSLSTKIDKISGKSEVLVRFYAGRGLDYRAKTNLFLSHEHWDSEQGKVKIPQSRFNSKEKQELIRELTQLDFDLAALSKDIRDAFSLAGSEKKANDWLQNFIIKRWSRQQTPLDAERDDDSEFFQCFEKFVVQQNLSDLRRRHYLVVMRALKRFAIYNSLDINFTTLSSDMLRDFEAFLANEHQFVSRDDGGIHFNDVLYEKAFKSVAESQIPKQRGKNTINGILSKLHVFVHWAIRNNYLSKDPFDNFEVCQAVYGTPFYLTKEERNLLYASQFPSCPALEVQRDIFVFQCFIGCRVGDLMKMTHKNVINGAIEYIPRKTKDGHPYIVRVPISPTAQEILERYKDLPNGRLLPFVCSQDYNRDIKKMLRLAGIDRMVTVLNTVTREEEKHPIWEVASSHMARRTFIGNLYQRVQDPNLIAKISGHVENSRAFSRYRQIDEEMAKETILKLE